jgi:rfaE bifunctional protein kinase chain/domain
MRAFDFILDRFPHVRVLVIGDLILDQYIWGVVNRISPEAPIPVVEVTRESFSLGGAANVANNVRSLGAAAEVCGVVGDDGHGRMLLETLAEKGIGTRAVVQDLSRTTTLKTRIVAHKQQVVRVDRENAVQVGSLLLELLKSRIQDLLSGVDAVIIEDYGKGVIQPDLLKEVLPLAKGAGKIVTVDPKKDHFLHYRGVTSITPNRQEAQDATGIRIADADSLHRAGAELLERLACDSVLLKLGEQGVCLFERGKPPLEIPARAREVYDVSGAGDTVIAVFTTALVAGATLGQAAVLSNVAGGLVVEKLGTATVNREELLRRLREEG